MPQPRVEIPYQPLRFTKDTLIQSGEYHMRANKNIVQEWQTQDFYVQPYEFKDRTSFQIALEYNEETDPAPYLQFLRSTSVCGEFEPVNIQTGSGTVTELSPAIFNTFAGDFYQYNGAVNTSVLMTRFQWEINFAAIQAPDNLPAGIYYFALTVGGEDNEITFLSEPISLKDEHKGTVKIDWSNSRNRDNLFYTMNPNFTLRVDGCMGLPKYGNDYESYTTAGSAISPLKYQAFESRPLIVGGIHKSVAPWVLIVLNRALGCEYFVVDGEIFVPDEGAQIESTSPGVFYPNVTSATVDLRPAFPDNAGVFPAQKKVFLFEIPDTAPYDIHKLKLTAGSTAVTFNAGVPYIVGVDGSLAAFISSANGLLAASGQFFGAIAQESGTVYYNAVAGDPNTINSVNIIQTLSLKIGAAKTLPAELSFAIAHRNAEFDINWGDGTETEYVNAGSTDFVVMEHVMEGAASSHDIYIFFPEFAVTSGLRLGKAGTMKISSLAGSVPDTITEFRVLYNTMTSFSFNVLAPALKSLAIFYIQYGTLATVNYDAYATLTTAPYKLTTVNMFSNKLSSAEVDKAFVDLVARGALKLSGGTKFINLKQQPAAPPTGASASQRLLLASYSWSITVDTP